MACNLNIPFTETATTLVQTLKSKVEGQGGTFTGNEAAGSMNVPLFGSHVSGSYTISGQQMNLIIDHKPFLISCNQIQSYLVGNL